MLTDEEMKEIEKEFPHYEQKKAACIDALKIVQEHRGWVSDEGIQDIATFLDMTSDEVGGVASFYNLIFRKPVGKNVIFLCDSVSCWVMGCERVLSHLQNRLKIKMGETTSDGQYTLLPIACLGVCEFAPAAMMNSRVYKNLNEEEINRILKTHLWKSP